MTKVRLLEKEAKEKEKDLRLILNLLKIPEDRLQRFLGQCKIYLAENRKMLNQAEEHHDEVIKRLFINMHTIKGSARTYELQQLADVSHEVESSYAKIIEGSLAWDQDVLLSDIDRVEKVVDSYETAATDKLGWEFEAKSVKMPRRMVESLLDLLVAIEGSPDHKISSTVAEAEKILIRHCFHEMTDVIEEASRGLDSVARDLEKPVPEIVVEGAMVVVKDDGVDMLHSILTHLFRNSLDHGVEKPETRQKLGKREQGLISIWTEWEENWLDFYFKDDGNGLNLDKLQKIGQDRGLISANAEDMDIAKLIFHAGLSTKEEVSEISGRGVGMDAVKSYVEENGGELHLLLSDYKDRKRVPFTFQFKLPLDLCFVSNLTESQTIKKEASAAS